jgi:hypothetical protein
MAEQFDAATLESESGAVILDLQQIIGSCEDSNKRKLNHRV